MKIFLSLTFVIAAAVSAWFFLSSSDEPITTRPEISAAKQAKIEQRVDAVKADLSVDEENERRLKELQQQMKLQSKRN